MYILKNSLVSIFRNKGRNILIGLIILTIACASTVTLAIRNTANSIVKNYEEAHDLIATLSFDRNQLMQQFKGGQDAQKENIEAFNNIEAFTIDDVKNYGDSEYYKIKRKTGIYTDNNDNDETASMYSASANTIITGSGVIDLLVADDNTLVTNITPSFILSGEEDIEGFTAEIKEKGLNEYYTVNTNLDELQNATKSIENVKTFATTFLIITLIISSLVLFVINMINIRERKYEIGVFRTIGMNKFKLTLQFIVELLIVATIALIIGAIIGGFLAKPVGNMLLENEIETSQGEQQQISENFGKGGMHGYKQSKG